MKFQNNVVESVKDQKTVGMANTRSKCQPMREFYGAVLVSFISCPDSNWIMSSTETPPSFSF